MESSSIPAALDALVALCTSSPSLSGVLISDGPLPQRPSEKRVLIIGGTDTGEDPSVEGSQEFVTIPGRERNENYTILCTALAWSGSPRIKPLRDQAFQIVSALETLLRPGSSNSNPTLNGTVSWAHVVGPIIYSPIFTESGSIVRVYFQIECRQRLS